MSSQTDTPGRQAVSVSWNAICSLPTTERQEGRQDDTQHMWTNRKTHTKTRRRTNTKAYRIIDKKARRKTSRQTGKHASANGKAYRNTGS